MSLVRLKQIESGTEIAEATEYVQDNFYEKVYYDSDSGAIVITVPLTFGTTPSTPTSPTDTDTGSGGSTVSGGGSGGDDGGDDGGGGTGGGTGGSGGGSGGGGSSENSFATINDITNAINAVIGQIPSSYATLGNLYKLIIKLHDPNQTEGITLPGYDDSDTTTITLPPHSGGGGSGGGGGTPGGPDDMPLPTDTSVLSPPSMWYGSLFIYSENTGNQPIGRFIYNNKEVIFYADLSGYAPISSPEFTGTPTIKNSNIPIPTEAPSAADRDKIPTVAFVYNYLSQKIDMIPGTLSALNQIKEILNSTNTPTAKLTELLSSKLDKSDITIESFNTDGQEIGKITLKDTDYVFKTDFTGYAPLNSPTFAGKPTAPAPPTGSNDNQVATTGFVVTEVARLIDALPTVVEQLEILINEYINDEYTFGGLLAVIETKVPLEGDSTITGDIVIDGNLEVKGSIKGTFTDVSVASAERADKDGDGNVIKDTYAPIDSPEFTGIPKAKDAIPSDDSSTRLATTAFVQSLIKGLSSGSSGGGSGGSIGEEYKNFDAVWAALNNDPYYYSTVSTALSGKQPLHDALTSISNLNTSVGNNIIYTTAVNTYNTSKVTNYALTLIDDGSPSEARETLQVVHRRRPGENNAAAGKYGFNANIENMRYVRVYPTSQTSYIRGEGFTFNDARETNTQYTDWSIKSVSNAALTWLKGQESDYKAIDSDHADVADICKYNAGTATILRDIQNIDGINFDGSANICRFTVDTGAAIGTARSVTISSKKIASDTTISPSSTTVTDLFKLVSGARITVLFKNGCSSANPTLNVNNTGAVPIKYRGHTLVAGALPAGCVYDLVYYDSAWHVVGTMSWTDTQNTSSNRKQASMATMSDKTGSMIQYYTKPEADYTFVELGTSEYAKEVIVTNDKINYRRGDNTLAGQQQIFMLAYDSRLTGTPTNGIWFNNSAEVISYYNGSTDKRFGAVYK